MFTLPMKPKQKYKLKLITQINMNFVNYTSDIYTTKKDIVLGN